MNCDINVISIENVFHRQKSKWERDKCETRHYDAVVFFTEGEIEYKFPNKTILVKKGDILFLSGDLPYCGKRHTEYCSYYVIDFLCADKKQFSSFGAPCAFTASSYQDVLQQLEGALQLWNRSPIGVAVKLKAQLYALLSEYFASNEVAEDQPGKNHILRYIEKNLSDPTLTVAKICKELYISDSQLRRTIHQLAGVSPNKYITAIRLNKAKLMLSTTKESVKDISFACGFTSPYYFSRAFTNATGMPPSEYRAYTAD